jgi:putative Mg2+ transporter-C (MgtC) family protein
VSGQGWVQVAELALALALSLAIGAEREFQRKDAGMRTLTTVGIGSALFVMVSKYGFSDVIGPGVALDPSRVAAQIVSGVGFIGGGLIFVRGDAVRGLTTAASVWLTAAVGAAAGAGLAVLATVVTVMYFVIQYGLRPLWRWKGPNGDELGLVVSYHQGTGVLRDIVNQTTAHGFSIAGLTTRSDAEAEPDQKGRIWPALEHGAVEVFLLLRGRGDMVDLASQLSEFPGVSAVRSTRSWDE